MNEQSDDPQVMALELKGLRKRVDALEQALSRSKRQGDTLREANTLLTSIIENTDDYILFSNARAEPMFFNSAYAGVMKELLGIEMRPGLKPHSLLPDAEARAWWDALHQRVLGGEKFTVDYEHPQPDGSTRFFEVSYNPIWIDGQVQGFSEFTRDVTPRKHDEQERQELQMQLLQAQKMEALGKLAGGMAHDFNNLLAVILGNAELLLDGCRQPKDRPRLEKIVKVTQHARDLTTKLLAFARREKLETRPVSLGELSLDVLEILHGSVPKTIRIQTDFQGQSASLEASVGQITVALLNICINACDAMPDGGVLTLQSTCETLPVEDPRLRGGASAGDYARIRIADSGCGIEPEQHERVFEPFFTTKVRGRGTGLGLAVSLGIVQAHDGFIELDSRPGQGTTVDVYLPLSEGQVLDGRGEGDAPTAAPSNASILVVDDEEDFLSTVADQLRSLGFSVHVARSGAQAVELLAAGASTIDLVLLDLIMPDMDGTRTYAALREVDPDVPVVLCSGFSREGQASALLESGAADYLQKPFDFQTLQRVILRVLERE